MATNEVLYGRLMAALRSLEDLGADGDFLAAISARWLAWACRRI